MLTTWTPAHMPEKEEIKTRLQTARSQLYDFQMKIKEHKIPVIVPLKAGDLPAREVRSEKSLRILIRVSLRLPLCQLPQQKN